MPGCERTVVVSLVAPEVEPTNHEVGPVRVMLPKM
jgi:hypothetical protein